VSRLEALKVFVAWKNTRESRRAVLDGMPFLERAETVDLVEIRESGETDSLHDVAAFLAAHGVRFQAQGMERDASGSIEEQLSALAQRAHATLLVAGGYGHTRIRELVFGGVTRSLITSSPLPCLLSH
jgi:nucleotide-binding universal stress UspA family protein